MPRMTHGDVDLCWEALESVPRLPSYATRALHRLKAEMALALEQEAKLRGALRDVREVVEHVDPWDGAP